MSKTFKLVSYNLGNGTNGFIEEDNTQQSYNKVISSILNRKKNKIYNLKTN